jgi:hypothetical protein
VSDGGTPFDEQTEGLWINSDPRDDGSYTVTVSLQGDRTWAFTPFKLRRYAAGALRVVAEAEYEQAVINQLRAGGVDLMGALETVAALRHHRPANDAARDCPLHYESGVNPQGKAFIKIMVGNEQVGQLDPPALRGHAMHAYEADPVADLDAAYRKVLTQVVGLSDDMALSAVSDLGDHREPEDGSKPGVH